MNTDNLQNNLNERESLSADEQKIRGLLGNLEKVSAPNDFDFRLKARIAAGKDNTFQPSAWRTLRYALPLSATLIIAAFMLIQAGYFSSEQNTAQETLASVNQNQTDVVNNSFVPSNMEIAQVSDSNKAETNAVENLETNANIQPEENLTVRRPKQPEVKFKQVSAPKNDSGGSRDLAQRPNIRILPPGFSSNSADVKKYENQENPVSARQFLEFIGIETDGNNLKVKAVRQNSPAERSGVKSGDIIEAIGDQKPDQINFPKLEGLKTITVSRDDKIQKIELIP